MSKAQENPGVRFRDDTGRQIDARFLVEQDPESLSVVLQSSGASNYNREYNQGLRILLRLLALRSATLLRIAVDSSKARSLFPKEESRALPSFSRPRKLSPSDTAGEELRNTLQREQEPIAQAPGAKGGNRQKRIRIRVAVPGVHTADELERVVLGEVSPMAQAARNVIENPEPDPGVTETYDPTNKRDVRLATWKQIRARQGQPKFRDELMTAYDSKCSISACGAAEVLEAAHIQPYRGAHTHHVENGLLLRADLHTLFDRFLLTVASSDWTVLLSPALRAGYYRRVHGRTLRPMTDGARPNTTAINEHREGCKF